MSPEGKPIQVNSNALQAIAAQNAAGMIGSQYDYIMQNQNQPQVDIFKTNFTIQAIL